MHKLESRLPGEISITSDMQMTPPYGRRRRGTEEHFDGSERRKWKSWLKTQHPNNEEHGIKFHHFLAMGKQWKQWQTLFSWAPKSLQMVSTAMKLKRRLLLGRKAMINLDRILKSRDITLPTKVRLVKAMVFPVVMHGSESWTIRKLSTKELMLLNCGVGEGSWVPWPASRSNQSIWLDIEKFSSIRGVPVCTLISKI